MKKLQLFVGHRNGMIFLFTSYKQYHFEEDNELFSYYGYVQLRKDCTLEQVVANSEAVRKVYGLLETGTLCTGKCVIKEIE